MTTTTLRTTLSENEFIFYTRNLRLTRIGRYANCHKNVLKLNMHDGIQVIMELLKISRRPLAWSCYFPEESPQLLFCSLNLLSSYVLFTVVALLCLSSTLRQLIKMGDQIGSLGSRTRSKITGPGH